MNKSLIILLLIFTAKTLVSCATCGDDHEDARIQNFIIHSQHYQAEHGISNPVSEPLPYNELEINILIETINESKFKNSGFASANGCSPAPPIVLDAISSLFVSSGADYNEFLKGSDLSSILQVDYGDGWAMFSSDDLGSYYLKYQDYLIMFRLTLPPSENFTHEFTFDIELEDGRKFTLTTEPITFTAET